MKVTFVLSREEISKLSVIVSDYQENFIDYFFERTRLIRWYKNSTNTRFNKKFFEKKGQIDISIEYCVEIDPDEARKKLVRKDIKFLVNKKFVDYFGFKSFNTEAPLYRVVAEDVQNKTKIFDEFHLILDTKDDQKLIDNIPFAYKDKFIGNIYDYIEQRM